MVTRSEERRRDCTRGNWGKFEGGERWLHSQESVIGVVGYYGVV